MGKEHCVYSWRLDHNDVAPKGKRRTSSLREMEKKIQADQFDHIVTNGGNMTVLEFGYGTVINLLKKAISGR